MFVVGEQVRASLVGRPFLSATATAGISEPGVRANALGTLLATERVPSREHPLSAIFSSLTWALILPLLWNQTLPMRIWRVKRIKRIEEKRIIESLLGAGGRAGPPSHLFRPPIRWAPCKRGCRERVEGTGWGCSKAHEMGCTVRSCSIVQFQVVGDTNYHKRAWWICVDVPPPSLPSSSFSTI